MDAQQELYTEILTGLMAEFGKDNVYDGRLPPEGTPYPFVYMGDVTDSDDTSVKDRLWGTTETWGTTAIRVHVWHNRPTERGTVSDIMTRIKYMLRRICSTQGYTWDLRSLTSNVLPDNTTKTPLLHGVVDATYKHF